MNKLHSSSSSSAQTFLTGRKVKDDINVEILYAQYCRVIKPVIDSFYPERLFCGELKDALNCICLFGTRVIPKLDRIAPLVTDPPCAISTPLKNPTTCQPPTLNHNNF